MTTFAVVRHTNACQLCSNRNTQTHLDLEVALCRSSPRVRLSCIDRREASVLLWSPGLVWRPSHLHQPQSCQRSPQQSRNSRRPLRWAEVPSLVEQIHWCYLMDPTHRLSLMGVLFRALVGGYDCCCFLFLACRWQLQVNQSQGAT